MLFTKNIKYLFGLVLVALFILCSCSDRHNWEEHYRNNSNDPYGTAITFKLLKDYLTEDKLEEIKDSLHLKLQDEETTGSYFYLGPDLWMDSLRRKSLLNFVARGNDAFIFTPTIAYEFLDSISHKNCVDLTYERDSIYYDDYLVEYYVNNTTVSLNLTHPNFSENHSYPYNFRYRAKDEKYNWDYLPPDLFCEYQYEFATLGTINDTLVNFAKTKYGDGNIYLHTTPLAFTNFHIIKKDGREYSERVFSHIKKGPILWDATKRSFEYPSRNRGFSKSPLQYILSQPSLAWGWYILLGMAVLYLIFRAKRRQRVIPVLEKNENTSLEFINTIGRLYFVQNNHRQLALEKMKLFLSFIRERYNIPTKELNDVFKKQLSIKSEIPIKVVDKIFLIHKNISQSKFASENTLIAFHKEMEKFYLNCK